VSLDAGRGAVWRRTDGVRSVAGRAPEQSGSGDPLGLSREGRFRELPP
jgi:hypothetical protein